MSRDAVASARELDGALAGNGARPRRRRSTASTLTLRLHGEVDEVEEYTAELWVRAC